MLWLHQHLEYSLFLRLSVPVASKRKKIRIELVRRRMHHLVFIRFPSPPVSSTSTRRELQPPAHGAFQSLARMALACGYIGGVSGSSYRPGERTPYSSYISSLHSQPSFDFSSFSLMTWKRIVFWLSNLSKRNDSSVGVVSRSIVFLFRSSLHDVRVLKFGVLSILRILAIKFVFPFEKSWALKKWIAAK